MAKKTLSIDDKLAEHLNQAEQHLIDGVKLFLENQALSRRVGYFERLVRAQEMITSLYREELVRQRGSKRVKGGRK